MSIGAISGYQFTDVDNPQSEKERHHFRKKFHRNKGTDETVSRTFIPDTLEPKVNVLSHCYMFKIFGWNTWLIVIGCIGAMGYGVIPVICQYLLGSLIDTFASPTVTSESAGRAVNKLSLQLLILAISGKFSIVY